jgi:hypothetical protein
VFWTPDAEEALARLLAATGDSAAVAGAARVLDRHLASLGSKFGESRDESMRIGFVSPLGIKFEVLEDVRTVIVHNVWRIDRK